MTVIKDALFGITSQLASMNFFDILDIALVSLIFYYTYRFVRERRAGKLAVGILFIIFAMLISELLEMQALSYLIGRVMQVGVIGLIILFQNELRAFLEKMGGSSSFISKNIKKDRAALSESVKCIDAVVAAVSDFSTEKTGALIIFERTTKLGDVIKTGTVIDAMPETYMIKNIFFNKAPMHDGALIIRNNRLHAAGCFLPLSTNNDIIKDLGTRHRAGIGMSENSDAVVIIVSEENGVISLAVDGRLTRDYDNVTLKRELVKLMLSDKTKNSGNGAEEEK